MIRFAAAFIVLVAVGIGYIRLAPSDPAVWNVAPPSMDGAWDQVVQVRHGALLRLQGDGAALLARLDQIAVATPRTLRLAGSPAQGRITWITRSLLIGFPDYTTAEAHSDGLVVYARQRFGGGDLGVNAARLAAWLSALSLTP